MRGRVATGQQVAWPVVAVDLFWPVAVVIVVVVAVVVVAVVARFSNCPLNARRVSKTITRRLGPLRLHSLSYVLEQLLLSARSCCSSSSALAVALTVVVVVYKACGCCCCGHCSALAANYYSHAKMN